jgi:hypothetical protein
LPIDIWGVIINHLTLKEGPEVQYTKLAFIATVSKQLNSICKKHKQQIGIQSTVVRPTEFQQYFAENGYISCMIYAYENGCPWKEDTCSSAAWNGHLEMLKYAWRWFGDLLVVPGGCSDLAQLMPTACFHAHFLCAVPDVGYV